MTVRKAFNRASAKPEGPSGIDFLEAILRERPDLRDKTAYFPGHYLDEAANDNEIAAAGHTQGGCSHTVFIGDEVFKGPTGGGNEEYFDREHKVLKQLEGQRLPVPRVTCVGQQTQFFGMTRMPGIKLSKNFLQEWRQDEVRALACDLADFMIGMAKAFPRQGKMFMTHQDLKANNIMIDPETRKLTAVIDFGIAYYSPGFPAFGWNDKCYSAFNKMLRDELDSRRHEQFGVNAPFLPPPPFNP